MKHGDIRRIRSDAVDKYVDYVDIYIIFKKFSYVNKNELDIIQAHLSIN